MGYFDKAPKRRLLRGPRLPVPAVSLPVGEWAGLLLPAIPNASSSFIHREMAMEIKSKHRGCSYLSTVFVYVIPVRYSMKYPFIVPLFSVHALRFVFTS